MNKSTNWFCPIGLEEEHGFSRSRQATLRSQGKLPFYKRGSYIRYKRTEIDDWLEEGKVV